MTFQLTGVSAMRSKLVGIKPNVLRKAMQSLNVEAEEIMTDSKANYVPVDEGTLRNTGHVVHAKKIDDNIVVHLRYGPIVTAIVIHEHPKYSPRSWSGGVTFGRGGPKYLERPLRARVPGMAARIAADIGL